MLVFMKRQELDHIRTRALVQGTIDEEGKATQKAFDEYMGKQFPHLRKHQVDQDKLAKVRLLRAVAAGPIMVTPLMSDVEAKSRLRRTGDHVVRTTSNKSRRARYWGE